VPLVCAGAPPPPCGAAWHGGPFHRKIRKMLFVHTPGSKWSPATPYDAKGFAQSRRSATNNPVLFLTHIPLPPDKGTEFPTGDFTCSDRKSRGRREGSDLTIVSYAARLHTSLASRVGAGKRRSKPSNSDLRTLLPLDRETFLPRVRKTNKLARLYTKNTRTGGIASV